MLATMTALECIKLNYALINLLNPAAIQGDPTGAGAGNKGVAVGVTHYCSETMIVAVPGMVAEPLALRANPLLAEPEETAG